MNKEDLIYKVSNYTYNFYQFRTIRYFIRIIYIPKIGIDKANKEQSELLMEIVNFNRLTKPHCRQRKIF